MKTVFRLVIFLLLITFILPAKAYAQADTGWIIKSFDSLISINQDSSVRIVETISVDFGNLNKHGIYRTIPVKYSTRFGNAMDIRFNLNGVSDEKGIKYDVTTSRDGSDIELKIGDPNRTITGRHVYVIDYNIQRVITIPFDRAEFYWNVTGDDWPVPIEKAVARIHTDKLKFNESVCFVGSLGSTNQDCTISDSDNFKIISTSNIAPGEGFTIAVSADEDLFIFPTRNQKIIWFITDNWIYLVPIFVLFFMIKHYITKGRDKRFINIFYESEGIQTVPLFEKLNALTAFHPPDDLTPGEVGVIVDEMVHKRDITATIIDLAVRGFITIKEEATGRLFKKSQFTLNLVGKDEIGLTSYEVSTLDMIFTPDRQKSIKLSKLPKDAYKYLPKIQDNLYKDVVTNGYFIANPKTVRTKYVVLGGAIIFVTFFVGPILGSITGQFGAMFAGIVTGIIVILFSFAMPSRTAKGRKALAEIVGLREYVRVGAWRQKEYEKRNFFEETLPYTIAFGLATKFIRAFDESSITKPDWYQSSGVFRPVAFSNALANFDTSIAQGVSATMPKSASSGGSGFSGGGSGGGFGGGGGGSW